MSDFEFAFGRGIKESGSMIILGLRRKDCMCLICLLLTSIDYFSHIAHILKGKCRYQHENVHVNPVATMVKLESPVYVYVSQKCKIIVDPDQSIGTVRTDFNQLVSLQTDDKNILDFLFFSVNESMYLDRSRSILACVS